MVISSDNQILISYYLKEKLFSNEEIELLNQRTDEKYWFQNYHLILYTDNLKRDLENSIKKYLIPSIIEGITKLAKKELKMKRYFEFYKDNLSNGIELINSIYEVNESIEDYLELKIEESEANFQKYARILNF